MTVPQQAIILAAGEGRRLRPYTETLPKPLMPFLNLPLLRHTLRLAARSGVSRVWINAWHHAQKIVDFVGSSPEPGLEINVVVEDKLLGTGGGLANIWPQMERSATLLLLPDIVADFDIAALYEHHQTQQACATMALTAKASPAHYGAVHTDHEGRITDIAGLRAKPTNPDHPGFVNASAHILEPEFLDRLPVEPSCFVRQGYVPALDDGLHCRGWVHKGAWHDTGSPAALLAAQHAAISGALPTDDALLALGGRRFGASGYVHPSAELADDVQLIEGTTVAQNCVIGAGVQLSGCLVMPDTHVPPLTRAQDQILGGPHRTSDIEAHSRACT